MRRFGHLIFFAILVVSIPGLLLASNKTVKVGIYQNKPKVFIDSAGKPQGVFIDILNDIAAKEGWQLDYVPSTWEKNLEKLEKAEIDLLLDIAESEGRAGLFDFNKEIIFSNWAIVYVQKHSKIQSILDLKGKKIAALKGDISYEDFSRNMENLGIYATFEEVDQFSEVFELITQEKVDAGIISRLYGLQHEDEYNAARSTIICCPRNLYFAVPKDKNQDLIEKIDQNIYQLKRDDQSIYYASLIKWIEGISPWKFPAWLVWLLVLAGGTLTAFAAGLVALKRQVNVRTDPGEYVLLEIADTGHGIEKEVRHRIYEPFFTTKDPEQGTGLGLSMVYGIVKNHHGHIECDSEPGAGTRFNIYFPAAKSITALKDEISTKKEKLAGGNETILLVEDNESILDALKRMLEHFEYTVITASNGEKAIEIYLAEQERIDLVILALNIPGMGGRRCLERLLEIKPELKAIVTSGSASAANFKTVYNGANAVFVEKPYQLEELLKIIRQVLDEHS